MRTELALATNVGLRHVIEDGVSILDNTRVPPERRRFVLDDLIELLQEAVRGSELLGSSSLLVAGADRSAVDAISLLDRYLRNDSDAVLRDELKASAVAFTALRDGKSVSPSHRKQVVRFMRELLSTLERSESSDLAPDQADDQLTRRIND